MKRRQTSDFLILLEASAKEHNRSKTQEGILGLSILNNQIKQPQPFKWREKISNEFIERAIGEGRDFLKI